MIKTINPVILVKGSDYKGKNIIGQDLVEETKLVEFVEGKSTTQTVKKIQNL